MTSPDGRWLAFGSTASGRDEICVRGFPDATSGQVQILGDGGAEPVRAHSTASGFHRDRDAPGRRPEPGGGVEAVEVKRRDSRNRCWTAA
jgi:hypothetical protein